MFFHFDSLAQALFIVLFQHGNAALSNDGPGIHSVVYQMNSTACNAHLGSENVPMCMSAWEMGEE
jgi:hypothetical protein